MYATLVYAFVSSDLDFLRHINTLTYLLTYLLTKPFSQSVYFILNNEVANPERDGTVNQRGLCCQRCKNFTDTRRSFMCKGNVPRELTAGRHYPDHPLTPATTSCAARILSRVYGYVTNCVTACRGRSDKQFNYFTFVCRDMFFHATFCSANVKVKD